jgi:hypothetical protein
VQLIIQIVKLMRKPLTIILLGLVLVMRPLSSQAAITASVSPVGSATDFPAKPAHTSTGTLGANSSDLAGVAGMTLQGGTSQGIPAGTAIGEIFKWSGDKSILNSIDFVATGASGKDTYQIFLFDLGAGTFSLPSQAFAPRNHKNMFGSAAVVSVTNTVVKSFVELDFSGTNKVTLKTGHNYAFGLFSTSAKSDLCIERSGSAQSDLYGDGFTAANLKDTTDNACPFAGAIRNVFIGVYASPIPDAEIQ